MSKIRSLWDDEDEGWVLVDDSGTEYDQCSECGETFPLPDLSVLNARCKLCEHENQDEYP
jgi:formylmethanofuran dehydrogenase subunit E